MEVTILNEDFESVLVIDTFKSLIWVGKYCQFGEFELETPVLASIIQNVNRDYYAYLPESTVTMIVEALELSSEIESEKRLLIYGKSLESLLTRRILWDRTVLSGKIQTCIQKLLNQNIISPTLSERQIPNFEFQWNSDSRLNDISITADYEVGTNLYDIINALCSTNGLDYKIVLTDDNRLVFSLYVIEDRSYSQNTNPFVVFSPQFENFVGSNYLESNKELKNVALILGEEYEDDTPRKRRVIGYEQGLTRREMFVDANSVKQEDEEGEPITDAEYNELLDQKGVEELSNNASVLTFEGQANQLDNRLSIGFDYCLGDLVQVENEYGMTAKAQVTEYVITQDMEGIQFYPSFTLISDAPRIDQDTYNLAMAGRILLGEDDTSTANMQDFAEAGRILLGLNESEE